MLVFRLVAVLRLICVILCMLPLILLFFPSSFEREEYDGLHFRLGSRFVPFDIIYMPMLHQSIFSDGGGQIEMFQPAHLTGKTLSLQSP